MVDRVKDAVGMGPHSGNNARRDEPGYDNYGNPMRDEPGYDNYGNPRREGVVGAPGVVPHSGEPGYGTPGYDNYGNPRREGVVDRMKDAVGMGPHTGATRGENHTNVNPPNSGTGLGHHPHGTTTGYDHSGVNTGFGTGHHHDDVHVVSGTIPMVAMGERRVEPGYDASKGHIGHNHHGTLTGSPRKEGIVEKIKDAVGVGKHDNATHTHPGTTTGTVVPNTYGRDEPGLLNHGNTTTPGSYSHNHMVDTGLGHERHPGSSTGYPHEAVRTGHTYPHETVGDPAKVSSSDSDSERRGITGAMHDTRTGHGYDATRAGPGTGYDDANVSYPHNDAAAYGVEGAPPKKGIMTKIKEKLHH
jgi:hypothetical protein